MKELHTIQQDGTDGGATKCNPKQGFGWNEPCMLLLRLKCRGGRGKDPNDISHGRATGLLHYRALDTKILSNEKTRSIYSPVPIAVITFQTQIPFHSSLTIFEVLT